MEKIVHKDGVAYIPENYTTYVKKCDWAARKLKDNRTDAEAYVKKFLKEYKTKVAFQKPITALDYKIIIPDFSWSYQGKNM